MEKNCSNCERRFKEESRAGCQAFIEKSENCWAWTDDKDWEEKVDEEVRKYAMYNRLAYQREYRRKKRSNI